MTADPSKPALSTTGCLLRVGVAVAAGLVVIGSGAAGYFLWDQQKHRKALAAEVQAIRDAGEPLDGAELYKFYRVPEGEEDITADWVAALAPFTEGELAEPQRLVPFLMPYTLTSAPPHRPEPWPELAAAEQQLAPYRSALVRIIEVSRKPGGVRYPLDLTAGRNTSLPHLTAGEVAGRALQLQAMCHYQRGELAAATDDILALIQTGQTLRHEPLLTSQQSRAWIMRFAGSLTRYLAADPDFPAENLLQIQTALKDVEFETIRPAAFLAKRAVAYQTYSQPFVWDPRDPKLPIKAGDVVLTSRPGDAAMYLQWSARAIEIARLPFHEAMDAARDFDQSEEDAESAEARLPTFMRNEVTRADTYLVLAFLDFLGKAETESRALQAFCAVERFRRKKQRRPESLDELIPEYLAAAPLDPYSNQPLKFVQNDDFYVIYGVGLNRRDDFGNVELPSPRDDGVMSFYRSPAIYPDAPPMLGPAPGQPPVGPPQSVKPID